MYLIFLFNVLEKLIGLRQIHAIQRKLDRGKRNILMVS